MAKDALELIIDEEGFEDARLQEVFEDQFGLPISQGTLLAVPL